MEHRTCRKWNFFLATPTDMTTTTDPPFIAVESLYKSFGDTPVLQNVSFGMRQGDLVSIIGASGCGKSTLLRCLNFLEVPDSGKISIGGVALSRSGPEQPFDQKMEALANSVRSKVGMVFQNLHLFPHKTVLENITLAPMVVKRASRNRAETEAMALLEKVGLQDFAKRYPMNLSGGQAQRAAIARALAMAPQVMLYDEPTSALDPALVDEVLQVMHDLDREGMTQIVVTHEMRFARSASDYIIFMEAGQIIEISDADELFQNPRDERTRQFLKHFPR